MVSVVCDEAGGDADEVLGHRIDVVEAAIIGEGSSFVLDSVVVGVVCCERGAVGNSGGGARGDDGEGRDW